MLIYTKFFMCQSSSRAAPLCFTVLVFSHHPIIPAAELLPCCMAKKGLSVESLFSLTFLICKYWRVLPIVCHT